MLENLNTTEKIKGLLGSKDLTAEYLANLLDCTVATIYSRYKTDNWSMKELEKIAKAFNYTVKDLLPPDIEKG